MQPVQLLAKLEQRWVNLHRFQNRRVIVLRLVVG
jgi:hypothetical protein